MFVPMPHTTCVLFFPGSRPELLAKAVSSGAGLVCVDLEDAVAPEDKDEARPSVVDLLSGHAEPPALAVRINHPSTEAGEADIRAIGALGDLPAELRVMVPKAGSRSELDELHARLSKSASDVPSDTTDVSLIAVVETAAGLARVEDMACADGVAALLVGALDLSVDLGCALDWEPLLYARSRCVHAARLGLVEVIDAPFFDVDDLDGLCAEAERSRRLGFTGKAAIHPTQVPIIREAFRPDAASIERARRVIEAHERGPGGASLVDGVMVDRPAVEAARRVLSQASGEEA